MVVGVWCVLDVGFDYGAGISAFEEDCYAEDEKGTYHAAYYAAGYDGNVTCALR